MGDTGRSVINPCDSPSPIITMRDTQETNTPVTELVNDASAGQQCEVSSTTDGRILPEPIVITEANTSGGSGNKKPQQQPAPPPPPPSSHQQQQQQTVATPQTARAGGASKFHQFRAPQQCVQTKKKMWNKRQKCHHHLKYLHHAQQLQQQQLHHQQTQQQAYKKMLAHRGCNGVGAGCNACNGVGNGGNGAPPLTHHPIFCSRTKFFLPDKRPRKEVIIPPTKFLLGGNISDPLNLNSLQNEANSSNNNTPATTPRQSPITTPPKVEVIIPPNIHDPLHLLDPVDTMEYEKQLTSPMKRKSKSSKSKHRHRKKKPKRKRIESTNSIPDDADKERCATSNTELSTDLIADEMLLVADSCYTQNNSSAEFNETAGENNEAHCSRESSDYIKAFDKSMATCGGSGILKNVDIDKLVPVMLPSKSASSSGVTGTAGVGVSNSVTVTGDELLQKQQYLTLSTTDRESIKKDLRLDLADVSEQYHHHGIGGGNRKRKVSEGACSAKNKFRRLDSMDKIVSPVVPQPGAWKRPPRLVPSGARKNSRHRSTSVSETELLSPIDDSRTITDTDSIRADTPDNDSIFKHVDTASIGSPLSIASVNTTDNTVITSEKLLTSAALTQHHQAAAAAADSSAANANKMPKFRVDGAKYQYGNYDRYSGYRLLNEFMDVRLQVFQRNAELFRGKDILDIGCNVGHMTISIARNLAPKSILGIDIDKNLIARARKNLSLYVRIPKQVVPVVKAKGDNNKAAKAETATGSNEQQQQAQQPQQQSSPVTEAIDNHKESQEKDQQQSKGIKRQRNRKNRRKNNQNHHLQEHHQQQQQQQQQQHNHHHYYHHHHFHHHHLHHHPHQPSIESHLFPISFPLTYGGIPEVNAQLQSGQTASGSSSSSNVTAEFPKNIFFRQTNYVLDDEVLLNNDTQQYDLIVCLSVTKWIHLNFGDNGLKMAFKRMFNQLRPGGKLILEAQNWASYKKKKNLTETIYNNYRNIEFFPNKFHEYLLSNEVGFSHSYTLGVPRHMSKGFSRPIQLYAKGDFTPNHVRWSDAYNPQTPYESYRGTYATMPRLPHPVPSGGAAGGGGGGGGNSGSYSCRQTPMHQSTSQYYNPFESDSYQPSYDDVNQLYVFASPLYHTVWSPPASLRNSSSHTPVFGSVREIENEDGGVGPPFHHHVYPPNDDISSPNANGAFNSIRDPDTDDSQTPSTVRHVYANCESSSSPHVNDSETQDGLEELPTPPAHRNAYEQNGCGDSNES